MATKITDGIFIGDAEASQDPEFIELNKITYVINCAGRELPNLFEQDGLRYLTFAWMDRPTCTLFDTQGFIVVSQIASFIGEADATGDSILICSRYGHSRCIACVVAYLMYKFRWGCGKALDYVHAKRPDIDVQPSFLTQLMSLDKRLCALRYTKLNPIQLCLRLV